VQITLLADLTISHAASNVYPGASTSVLFNASSPDYFDLKFERGFAAAVTDVLALGSSSAYITGVAPGPLPGVYAVGVYINQPTMALAMAAVESLNDMLPSPNGNQNLELINAVTATGLPFVYEFVPYTSAVSGAARMNYSMALDYTTMSFTLQGVAIADLDGYGIAILESAIALAIDAAPDTVEVTGVAVPQNFVGVQVGVSFLSNLIETSYTNAKKLQGIVAFSGNNVQLTKRAKENGLPQITTLGSAGDVYTYAMPAPITLDGYYVSLTADCIIWANSSGIMSDLPKMKKYLNVYSGVGWAYCEGRLIVNGAPARPRGAFSGHRCRAAAVMVSARPGAGAASTHGRQRDGPGGVSRFALASLPAGATVPPRRRTAAAGAGKAGPGAGEVRSARRRRRGPETAGRQAPPRASPAGGSSKKGRNGGRSVRIGHQAGRSARRPPRTTAARRRAPAQSMCGAGRRAHAPFTIAPPRPRAALCAGRCSSAAAAAPRAAAPRRRSFLGP
jgi:hypothetical protein